MDPFPLERLPYPALISVVKNLDLQSLLTLTNESPIIYYQVKNAVRPVIHMKFTDLADIPEQIQFYETVLERFPNTTVDVQMRYPSEMEMSWPEESEFIKGHLQFARFMIQRFPEAPFFFTGAKGIQTEDPAKQFLLKCITLANIRAGYSDVFIKIAETMSVEDLQIRWPHLSGQTLLDLADSRGQHEIAEYIRSRIANNTAGSSMYVV